MFLFGSILKAIWNPSMSGMPMPSSFFEMNCRRRSDSPNNRLYMSKPCQSPKNNSTTDRCTTTLPLVENYLRQLANSFPSKVHNVLHQQLELDKRKQQHIQCQVPETFFPLNCYFVRSLIKECMVHSELTTVAQKKTVHGFLPITRRFHLDQVFEGLKSVCLWRKKKHLKQS